MENRLIYMVKNLRKLKINFHLNLIHTKSWSKSKSFIMIDPLVYIELRNVLLDEW